MPLLGARGLLGSDDRLWHRNWVNPSVVLDVGYGHSGVFRWRGAEGGDLPDVRLMLDWLVLHSIGVYPQFRGLDSFCTGEKHSCGYTVLDNHSMERVTSDCGYAKLCAERWPNGMASKHWLPPTH